MARNRYVDTPPVRTRLRKGDVVEVMSGKEKGKRGPIVDIDARRARVLVGSRRARCRVMSSAVR